MLLFAAVAALASTRRWPAAECAGNRINGFATMRMRKAFCFLTAWSATTTTHMDGIAMGASSCSYQLRGTGHNVNSGFTASMPKVGKNTG